MKKFFIALTILLAVTGVNFTEAADFTEEQIEKTISITLQNSAKNPLNLDVETFQKNFDGYMNRAILEMNAGNDTEMLQRIFLIAEPNILTKDANRLFVKNFLNSIAIVGDLDGSGKFKSLNFFGVQVQDKNEALIHVLILNAFVKGIAPDCDASTLLTEAKKSSDATVTKNGVKFSFKTDGNLNVVSSVAN